MTPEAVFLVALGSVTALAQMGLFLYLLRLPFKLYGTCLRITSFLSVCDCIMAILIGVGAIGHPLTAALDMIAATHGLTFGVAQLELLRPLLPFYRIGSERTVTILQIVFCVLFAVGVVPMAMFLADRSLEPVARKTLFAWFCLIGTYGVVQQLVMLHFVLFHLRHPPRFFRASFVALACVNGVIVAGSLVFELTIADTSRFWSSLLFIPASIFGFVSIVSMQLLHRQVNRDMSGTGNSANVRPSLLSGDLSLAE
ncbi:hypothetical protein HK105_200379 [Polyrhizophydium stewartii]|uniref:Integral membrane protein n=1 Tax=Polyrhizophydium stewartii TaxID=2732419 RepID=A0ABR4NL98_9FUNG